ncbi:hypothetical protein [Candidatus Vampirococcus lugosii]|uniref:Uncharacterized protein n=1 Tax=Candidatus Vampirococcus lugosii TaxID=2789015 RepID=A0ABS5QNR4_9BACT|nr:hypothetical protein [Candidatus Vampirococcus lugosii]MBS8122271.1 hypothetical protein [Candidatus Vampirococcus lugosii]
MEIPIFDKEKSNILLQETEKAILELSTLDRKNPLDNKKNMKLLLI